MKFSLIPPAAPSKPSEDVIRDYAFHLYEQSGGVPGRELDNWLEASACLNANILPHRSHNRLQDHIATVASASASKRNKRA